MKKQWFIISLLLLFIFSISINANDKFTRIVLPDAEPNFSGTLTNSTTNKYPADSILLIFPQNTFNYLLADSFVISLRLDSITGKYGFRGNDSGGINKTQISYQPVVYYPISNTFGYGNLATRDKIGRASCRERV